MRSFVLSGFFGGRPIPVSPQFAAAVHEVLGTLTFDISSGKDAGPLTPAHEEWEGDLQRDIRRLERRSNHWALTAEEQRRKDFLVHVRNVASTIRAIGEHHDPAEWGLDGWDAVHGNSTGWPCGCVTQHVFDHHSATNNFGHNRMAEDRKHFHIEPRAVCGRHWQHKDHVSLLAALGGS